jgi:outer membrane protein OmpA-like peptidoglycan-associated protein
MMERRREIRFGAKLVMALGVAALALGGCSSMKDSGMDPIEWYRDLSGESAHDVQDKAAANSENLKEGNKEPYPNLASVPPVPDTAISKADRDKLAQSLIADRQNAQYTDQQLRAGQNMAAVPPPAAVTAAAAQAATPAPVAPVKQQALATPAKPAKPKKHTQAKRGSEPPPRESSLKPPPIGAMPQGEQAQAPPPAPPGTPTSTPRSEEVANAVPPVGGERNIVVRAAQINFSPGPFRARIPEADRKQLEEVAQRAIANNARIRVVGHGGAAAQGDLSQREFQSFDAALDNAKAVALVLTKMGVPASQIDVETAANVNSTDAAEVFLEY